MFEGILGSIFGAKPDPCSPAALSKKLKASPLHQAAINSNVNWLGTHGLTATQLGQQQAMNTARARQQAAIGQQSQIYFNNNGYTHMHPGFTDVELKSYLKLGIDLMNNHINFKKLNKSININSDVLPIFAQDMFKELFALRNVMLFNNTNEAIEASKTMFDNSIPAMIIIKTLTLKTQTFKIAGLQVQTEDDLVTLKMCL